MGHVDAAVLGRTTGCSDQEKKKMKMSECSCGEEAGIGKSLTSFMSPMEMTIGEFLTTFNPESMNTWVVPEDISLRGLLRVMVRHKLHHVWVASRGVKPQPLVEIGKKLRMPSGHVRVAECREGPCLPIDGPRDQEMSDAMLNSEELYGKGVLGVVTLNDVLRWVARDNLWLKEAELPSK